MFNPIIERLTIERAEAEKEIEQLRAELRAAVDALRIHAYGRPLSIASNIVAAYDANHPEVK